MTHEQYHAAAMDVWYENLPDGQQQTFAAQESIAIPGGQDNRLFVIEKGRARICLFGAIKQQTLGYLQPGSVYVTHSPAWVEAMEPTTIRSWSLQQVKSVLAANPLVALSAIREVGSLLGNAIALIENLAFRSVESRLAHYLITEFEQQSSHHIRLIGNTELLASLLGTSRQTTSTILNRFEKTGLIARHDREHVIINQATELEKIANQVSAG